MSSRWCVGRTTVYFWMNQDLCMPVAGGRMDRQVSVLFLRGFLRHLPHWSLTSCLDLPGIVIKWVISDMKPAGLNRLLRYSSGLGHHNKSALPVRVGGDLKGVRVQQVSTYGDCSLAVSEEGHVFGWGNSEYRQLASVTDTTQVRRQTSSFLNMQFVLFTNNGENNNTDTGDSLQVKSRLQKT